MWKFVVWSGLAVSLSLLAASPAGATDPAMPKPRHKHAHAHHHHKMGHRLPGPVLVMQVTRPPTCGFVWAPGYPNYAQASCRDYDGVLAAYEPRSPTRVGVYTFRAHYRLC